MIKTENLSFSYNDSAVLSDINLEIEKGSFTAILGRNGSGKSTFAKHLNAILLPTEGTVYVNKMNTKDQNQIFNIRANTGMVFQNPDNQAVAAIVENEVAFAPENLGVPSDEIRRRVDECLKAVNMQKYAKAALSNLSGGQKQLIAIASALATEPQCIVLDEPTSMLDPRGRTLVLETLKNLNRKKQITVILVTHYMEEAAEADRVIVIDNGQAVLDDIPKKVFKNAELLKSLGLDVPPVTELTYILKKSGINIADDIIDTEECFNEIIRLLGDTI